MSHQSSPLSEEDGLNHSATNGFAKTNGNGAYYENEDTPMSEDDDVPLVCDPISPDFSRVTKMRRCGEFAYSLRLSPPLLGNAKRSFKMTLRAMTMLP